MSHGQYWECRNQDCGTFIRYALGDEAHLGTKRNERGPTFVFAQYDKCKELTDMFYGNEPVATGDLKALFAVARALRATVRAAEHSVDGVWHNDSTGEI